MKKGYIITFIFIFGLFALMAALIMTGNKRTNDIYKAHSWKQVEAVFDSSTSYTETEKKKYNDGTEYEESVTYYKWSYTYKVDGNTYTCSDKGHDKSEPSDGKGARTILVAEDDASVHLMYASEESLKKSLKNNTRILIITAGVLFAAVAGILMKNSGKRKR